MRSRVVRLSLTAALVVAGITPALLGSSAVVAGAASGSWFALRSGSSGPALRTYRDARFGWAIARPPSLRLRHYATSGGDGVSDGILVSNFAPDLSQGGIGSMDWLVDFPRTGVALDLWFGRGDLGP